MKITVTGINARAMDTQRAYAEYRLFTSIASHESWVRDATVVICHDASARQFVCSVFVDLGRWGRVKTQARAAHPSAAIDRAARRAGWLVDRRLGGDSGIQAREPAARAEA